MMVYGLYTLMVHTRFDMLLYQPEWCADISFYTDGVAQWLNPPLSCFVGLVQSISLLLVNIYMCLIYEKYMLGNQCQSAFD